MLSSLRARSAAKIVLMMSAAMIVAAMAIPAQAATLGQTWAERYVGGTDFQYAMSLAVSPDGQTVYITGISAGPLHEGDPYDAFATIAYNASTGAIRWIDRFSFTEIDNWASTIVVSPDGQKVFVTGTTPQGYPIIAYDAATGTRLWVKQVPPAGALGFQGRLAVSPDSGRVFFTGEVLVGDGPESEMRTVALRASTGSTAWSRDFESPGGLQSRPNAITVDPQGKRVFVTGSTGDLNQFPTPNPTDFVTVAYEVHDGDRLWTRLFNGPVNGSDDARAVVSTPNGQAVIVAGSSGGANGNPRYEVIAYNAASGSRLWATRNGTDATWRGLSAMTIDPSGSAVYVTGSETNTVNWSVKYRTVSFSVSTGAKRWSRAFNGTTTANAQAIAMSPDGTFVYVTGAVDSETSYYTDYGTVAYRTASGQRAAVARYVSPADAGAQAEAIGVSQSGAIFVTGRGGGAFATVAYKLT